MILFPLERERSKDCQRIPICNFTAFQFLPFFLLRVLPETYKMIETNTMSSNLMLP
jgi:hypothetical protein